MGYHLEGDLLEVCDCKVLCPCWIGEDPDNGTCDTILAYKMKSGTINGTDVAGLSLALMAHIPGNILKGNWSVAVYVDERASKAQEEALLGVWTGKFGGPVADLAKFVGKVLAVERAPITFTLLEGRGILKIGTAADCEMAPYKGAGDRVTTLNDSVFSTIPGSPAYVSKATKYKRRTAAVGLPDVNLENHNAIQGHFRFDC
ncbi:MAG TPA: DUF1326 domain-containing protein [Bryobacteraceae bacterium]|nr:DUF1326 domain-containing protein [Bryobacteraceae bacterium]